MLWCVAWTDAEGKRQWCAAKHQNGPHTADDFTVATACECYVVLPIGCEKRYPTCKECADRMIDPHR